MGTAGPLKLAEEILADGSGDPFFVLNRCSPGFALGNSQHAAAQQQLDSSVCCDFRPCMCSAWQNTCHSCSGCEAMTLEHLP